MFSSSGSREPSAITAPGARGQCRVDQRVVVDVVELDAHRHSGALRDGDEGREQQAAGVGAKGGLGDEQDRRHVALLRGADDTAGRRDVVAGEGPRGGARGTPLLEELAERRQHGGDPLTRASTRLASRSSSPTLPGTTR